MARVMRAAAVPSDGEEGAWELREIGAEGLGGPADPVRLAEGVGGARALVMVHGLDFDPRLPAGHASNPLSGIFAERGGEGRRRSWIEAAQVPADRPVVQFLWCSNALDWDRRHAILDDLRERRETPYEAAFRRARLAAEPLAEVLEAVARAGDGRADLMAHSLGTVAALAAGGRHVGRALLMHGVAGRAAAADWLAEGVEGGAVNLLSGRDATVRVLAGLAHRLMGVETALIGAQGGPEDPRWIDLALDRPEVRAWAEGFGWRLHGGRGEDPDAHWAAFARAGNLPLLARLVGDPDFGAPEALRALEAPEGARPPGGADLWGRATAELGGLEDAARARAAAWLSRAEALDAGLRDSLREVAERLGAGAERG